MTPRHDHKEQIAELKARHRSQMVCLIVMAIVMFGGIFLVMLAALVKRC
jgi:hypothetical protein